ncbi:TerB family tellurite resistance protein [bacterium]|nr:TerB family tellurite resistance protein [bacterium]
MLTRYPSDVPRIAAALAVSLISSDGVIDEEEKALAIEVGYKMVPGFSKASFERLLEEVDHLPSAYQLAAPLRKLLDDETKDTILQYLVAVAGADHQVVQVEAQELQAVADALGVPLPPITISTPED